MAAAVSLLEAYLNRVDAASGAAFMLPLPENTAVERLQGHHFHCSVQYPYKLAKLQTSKACEFGYPSQL